MNKMKLKFIILTILVITLLSIVSITFASNLGERNIKSVSLLTAIDGGKYYNNDLNIIIQATTEEGSMYKPTNKLYYAWTTSSTKPSSYKSISITNYTLTSVSYSIPFTETSSGNYYLYFEIDGCFEGFKIGPIKFDVTKPIVGTLTMKLGSSSGQNYINNTYTNENVWIGINNGTDGQSGHKSTCYYINETKYSSDQLLSKSGTYEILVETEDNVGNKASREYKVEIDKELPRIIEIKKDISEWTNETVTLTVDSIDDLSGVASLSFDGGKTWDSKTSKEYTENVNGIEIQVKDMAGNIAKETVDITNIDKKAPSRPKVTGGDTWVSSDKCELKLSGGDSESGLKYYYWKYADGSDSGTLYGKTANFYEEQDKEIKFWSIDKAGNWSSSTTTYVKIDRTAPIAGTIVLKMNDSKGELIPNNFTTSENVYIELNNGSDELSGIKTNTYKINGGEELIEPMVLTEEGTYTIEVVTTDNANNTATNTYIVKLDHRFTNYISDNNATCTQDGTKTAKCDRCEETDTIKDEGSAKGHIEVVDQAVEATCTATGLTEGKHCSVCNEILVAQEITPAKGHTEVIDKAIEATCTKEGKTEGKHCSVCNTTLVVQEIVPIIDHSFENGECTECGTKEEIEKLEISSENYIIKDSNIKDIKPATTIKDFFEKIDTNGEIKIYKGETEITANDAKIGTGMRVVITKDKEVKEFIAVVTGDLNGDGKMSDVDLLRMVRYKAGLDKTLSGTYLEAADIIKDNKPAEDRDLLKMVRVLVGLDNL